MFQEQELPTQGGGEIAEVTCRLQEAPETGSARDVVSESMTILPNGFPSCGRLTGVLLAATALLAGADGGPLAQRLGVNPILRHTAPAQEGPAKLPAGLNLVDWKQITAEYERHRHEMFPDGKGGGQSRSHYDGWLARFDGKGFAVQPDSAPWSWGQEVAVSGAASMHAKANRMEYRRPGITE